MKITFLGATMGYHQEGLSKAFYNILGDDYKYIFYGELPQYRKDAGFVDLADKYDFVVKANSRESSENVDNIINSSDVVIAGAVDKSIIKRCVERGIETYLFSERFFKKGVWRAFVPPIRKKVISRAGFKQKNFKVLAASAYLPYDLSLCGWYGDAYKWGYFTEVKKYDIDELLKRKSSNDKPVKILWAARFLKLKHPEKAIEVAKYLKKRNIPFEMEIIGYGELESFIVKKIRNNKLQDFVVFSGKKTVPEVHDAMEKADIFLMTSDYHEGWGVVINEALNHGCAVIADAAAGATRYLVKNGENGFIYKNGNIKSMFTIIEKLILDENYRKGIQKNAYLHMVENASPEVAAKRFVELCQGKTFDEGVCSLAPIIKSSRK